MEVTIREAEPSDETGLSILRGQAIKATFQGEYDRETVADLVGTVDGDLPTWIEDDRYLVLVAETEITPVCYAAFDRDRGELLTIVTSPDYRRDGFGSAVLERIETRAREDGHDSVTAAVPSVSVPFFEAQGFDRTGDADWYALDGVQVRTDL